MNLYYVRLPITDKKTLVTEDKDFAIPANTSDEALEKSKQFGENGALLSISYPMNHDWC